MVYHEATLAGILAELCLGWRQHGSESVIREVIAPFYARYGQPLPGTEAEPPPPPPPMSPPLHRRAPRSNAPRSHRHLRPDPRKSPGGTSGARHGRRHGPHASHSGGGALRAGMDEPGSPGEARQSGERGHPLSHHERRGMTDFIANPDDVETPEAIATLPTRRLKGGSHGSSVF